MTALGIDQDLTLTAAWTPTPAGRRQLPPALVGLAVVVVVLLTLVLAGWLGVEIARAVAARQAVSGG